MTGLRHGDASWVGLGNNHYEGTFSDGGMSGVGKFRWQSGDEYLGCWQQPVPPHQDDMPKSMVQLKRHKLPDAKKVVDEVRQVALRTRYVLSSPSARMRAAAYAHARA